MPRSSITITTEIDLDIDTAAKWFAGLTDDDWCKFFVAVAKEAESWGPQNEGMMYWATGRHLATCECSTDGARAMLHDIVRAMEYQTDDTAPQETDKNEPLTVGWWNALAETVHGNT